MCTNLLFFSSLMFITNTITAYQKEYYFYSFLFGTLTTTSVIHHTNYTIYTSITDKLAVMSVVVYGAYMVYLKNIIYQKWRISIILSAFMGCIFLFGYGYFTNNYCFHPDKGNMYHSLLHMISSVGHHCIIFV